MLLLALALAVGGPARAEDPSGRVSSLGSSPSRSLEIAEMKQVDPASANALATVPDLRPSRTFYRGELLPRLTTRLERHRDRAMPFVAPGEEWREQLAWEQMSDEVQRDVERATRKAVRDHLLENTRLSDVVDSLERRAFRGRRQGDSQTMASGAGPSAQDLKERRVDWDLGFHSGVPEVEMRYRLDQGDVRVNVGLAGSADVRYRHAAMGRTEVSAGYDADDEIYSLVAIFGF
jgi:hypothetical protein